MILMNLAQYQMKTCSLKGGIFASFSWLIAVLCGCIPTYRNMPARVIRINSIPRSG